MHSKWEWVPISHLKKVEKNVMKVWKPHNHWVLKTENSFDNAENEISKMGAISIKLIGIKLIK